MEILIILIIAALAVAATVVSFYGSRIKNATTALSVITEVQNSLVDHDAIVAKYKADSEATYAMYAGEEAEAERDWFFDVDIVGEFVTLKYPEHMEAISIQSIIDEVETISVTFRGFTATKDKGYIMIHDSGEVKVGRDRVDDHWGNYGEWTIVKGFPSAYLPAVLKIGNLLTIKVPPAHVDATFVAFMEALKDW
jgi:hypothetical protein